MSREFFKPRIAQVHKNIRQTLRFERWTFRQAPAQSDIIWQSMGVDENFSVLKTSILLILLFLFSVVILTPVMLVNQAQQLLNDLNLPHKILSSTTLNTYVSTYLTLLINVVLIPFFIDMMVLIEDFETKSDRQIAILNRNFVFMILNSVLLPLTLQTGISQFLSKIQD